MKNSKGQVLVLGALILAGITLGIFSIVKLSVQSQKQVHVQNVANNAAKSLATLGARDLNFKAVTNRAIIANEVVIGQLMALHSWFHMAEDVSVRTALFTSWIPYLNAATRSLSNAMQRMKRPIDMGVSAAIVAQDILIKGLEIAQIAFNQASWISTYYTAKHVVESSGDNYELSMLNHQSLSQAPQLWISFQERKQSEEYVEWVADSRDPFTRNRSYNWVDLTVVSIDRAGGSELKSLDGKVFWQSIDTLGIHQRILFSHHEYRFGGGSSTNYETPPRRAHRSEFGGTYQINRRTTGRARQRVRNIGRQRTAPYQYLLSEPVNEFPQITVAVVAKKQNEDDGLQEIEAIGIGKYEVSFLRQSDFFPRRDERLEKANMLNALWRINKKPIKTVDRLILERQITGVANEI